MAERVFLRVVYFLVVFQGDGPAALPAGWILGGVREVPVFLAPMLRCSCFVVCRWVHLLIVVDLSLIHI